jgi:WD40 repeat protein
MGRLLLAMVLLLLSGCAGGGMHLSREERIELAASLVPQIDSYSFRQALADYFDKPDNKAFAVNLETGRWGRSWGFKWVADAESKAVDRAGAEGKLLLVNIGIQTDNFLARSEAAAVAKSPHSMQHASAKVNSAPRPLPDTPQFDFEAGMHTAMINRMGIDPAGNFLLTPSDDRTVRLWNLLSGEPMHVFHLPIGAEIDGGMVQAAAVAPDGVHAAIAVVRGDWETSHSIYFIDLAEKKVVRYLDGLPEVALNLDFSDDGKFLAAALNGKAGVRVYRTDTYTLAMSDGEYGDRCMGIDFSRSGMLASASRDGHVRLYDQALRLQKKRRIDHGAGTSPYQLRFSPDERLLAVGMEESIRVEVLDAATLETVASPSPQLDRRPEQGASIFAVAWASDGNSLYAGGRLQERDSSGQWLHYIYRWQTRALEATPRKVPAGKGSILSLLPFGAGGVVWGASDPSWGIIDDSGNKRHDHLSPVIDARANRSRLLLSPEGTAIGYFTELGEQEPRLFSLAPESLQPTNTSLQPPRMAAPGLAVTGWKHTRQPMLNGQPLAGLVGESRCYAISNDGKYFVLGTDQRLYGFDDTGRMLWQQPRNGETWALNIAAEANLFVAGYSDGTFRWHDLADGRELLAYFPHKDSRRWIAWTPEGFFDHSPGGEELIGYRLNTKPGRMATFVNVSQLYQHFYRPDLVRKRLYPQFDGEIQAELARVGEVRSLFQEGLPPEVAVISPPDQGEASALAATLYIRLREQGGGAGRVLCRVNGIVVADINAVLLRGSGEEKTLTRTLRLEPGNNVVEVTAYNTYAKIESSPATLRIRVPAAETGPGRLHLFAVGVDRYKNPELNLNYAVSDSRAVAQTLEHIGRPLGFTGIEVKTLFDERAGKEAILQGFRQLHQQLGEDDLLVFYVAAHGISLNGRFYLLPWDVDDISSEKAIASAALATEELQEILLSLPARKIVMILDTCHAEGFSKDIFRYVSRQAALGKLVRATGRAILCSSSEKQQALEGHGGHGLFTYVLLEGLRGAADAAGNGDGRLTVEESARYVVQKVPELARQLWQYQQTPSYSYFGRDFPLGVVGK